VRELGTLYTGYAHKSVNTVAYYWSMHIHGKISTASLPANACATKSTKKHRTHTLLLQQDIVAPFQRVLHAAACTVVYFKPRDRVTPALQELELHWLVVVERIQYKLCLLVHKSLLGHTPEYISDLLTSVANIRSRSTLRASSCGNLDVDELATVPFLLLHREHGTGYRR